MSGRSPWLVLVVGGACLFGPSPERLDCLERCAVAKDTCILATTTAPQIQVCDGHSRRCMEECPR